MSIRVADRKLLWGRSRNRCAFPDCSQLLTVDLHDPESEVLGEAGVVLGEEAHIRSSQDGGPRHDGEYPPERLDSYANLILLCPTHHTLVDKDGGRGFTVEDLEKMRSNHEGALQQLESAAAERKRVADERLAAAIQVWEAKAMLDEWQNLTWSLNTPVPYIREPLRDGLFELGEWLLARDWPKTSPHVREAFDRFLGVVRVLTAHVAQSFVRVGESNRWQLERKYKELKKWNPPLYEELIAEHRVQCTMTYFLAIELTRAANRIIAAVREEVDPLYRFDEGVLLLREGDGIFEHNIVRIEYQERNWGDPFPPLSLQILRIVVEETAAEDGIDADDVNPYRLFDL
ncbi:HNH endonuclease signature motif containing protein [Pimelobacter simplex]|uniref:HNH endonuclease signature motif containing protein n=1 Tax=Nocardioides simplex TaxID=2045 RepID=UPI0019336634